MSRIPLHKLSADESGLAQLAFAAGPDDDDWLEYERQFAAELRRTVESFDPVLAPGSLTLEGVAKPEGTIALALLRNGHAELAVKRRTHILAALQTALECYTHDLHDTAGSIVSLQVLDTESHHGARRPLLVRTEHDGLWVLKQRPGASEQLILGAEGLFDTVNSLSGGRIHLPLLDVRQSAVHPEMSWQRWVVAPHMTRVGDRLVAAATSPKTAKQSWSRAGQLAGACAALGITDLGEENIVTRDNRGLIELVPVDTELFLDSGLGLHRTMLTRDSRVSANHHTGIENVPRMCTGSGPIVHADGANLVRARARSCRRDSSRSLLGNGAGDVGYASSPTEFVRGMVDAWVVIARNRDRLAALLSERAGPRRHLLRPTADYTSALAAWLTGEVDDPCDAVQGQPCDSDEARQLREADVPYIVRDIQPDDVEAWRLGVTLSALGPALRDAVEYVRDDLDPLIVDLPLRVQVALSKDPGVGTVSVGLPDTEQRALFHWTGDRVRLELPEACDGQECTHPSVRDRLLRLQRTDAVLRNAWTATEFTDKELHTKLCALTEAAVDWLDEVVATIGWPGRPTVGPAAAHAAAQLVQHLESQDRQAPLTQAMTAAALRGHVAWSDVAGASDALAVQRGVPQQFGTKFEKGADGLRPYALAAPDRIDDIRHGAGLDTLAEYRTRIERHLSTLPTPQDGER